MPYRKLAVFAEGAPKRSRGSYIYIITQHWVLVTKPAYLEARGYT